MEKTEKVPIVVPKVAFFVTFGTTIGTLSKYFPTYYRVANVILLTRYLSIVLFL